MSSVGNTCGNQIRSIELARSFKSHETEPKRRFLKDPATNVCKPGVDRVAPRFVVPLIEGKAADRIGVTESTHRAVED